MIDIQSSLSNRQIHRALVLLFKGLAHVQVAEMMVAAAKSAANELPLSKGTSLALFAQRLAAFAKNEEETELKDFMVKAENKPIVVYPKQFEHLDMAKTIREKITVLDEDDIATDPFIFLPKGIVND